MARFLWLGRRDGVGVRPPPDDDQAFFGIIIRMYYDDHAPSRFHAYYGEHSAQISIESLDVIGGSLPKRVWPWQLSGPSSTEKNFGPTGNERVSISHCFLF
ncbi:MAG: DUF4160 domain-containing protein [Myxococcaceae bacterium]